MSRKRCFNFETESDSHHFIFYGSRKPKFVTIIKEKNVQRGQYLKPSLEWAKEKWRVGEQDLKVYMVGFQVKTIVME